MTSNLCHPTLIVPHTLSTPVGLPLMNAYISFPSPFKHIAFDGRYLHGAPAELLSLSQENSSFPSYEGERITFLVNIWIGHEPLEASRLPLNIATILNDNYQNDCYESQYIIKNNNEDNDEKEERLKKENPLITRSFNLLPLLTTSSTINNNNKINNNKNYTNQLPIIPILKITEKETQLDNDEDDNNDENDDEIEMKRKNYQRKNYLDITISCGKWLTIPFVSSKSEWGKDDEEAGLELSIWLPSISFTNYLQRIELLNQLKKTKKNKIDTISSISSTSGLSNNNYLSSSTSYSSYILQYMSQIAAAKLEYEENEEFEDEFAEEFGDSIF